MEREQQRCEAVKQWKAFVVRKKEEKFAPRSVWHTFNLIPSKEGGYSDLTAQKHYHRMVCYLVADGIPSEVSRLYEDVPMSEVWELYGYKRAASW